MSVYTAYANSIVLKIDEANRALTNNGGSTPIVLGVIGDDCAERVYFEAPAQLSPEINLLENSDTVKVHVYVNYRNAVNEPYIQECSDVVQSVTSDMVSFSWIVTNKATINRGEVKFNVCVKRTVYNSEIDTWQLTNEWHTTTFIGKVLDGIDVAKKTPEVITHDSTTIEQLTVQTNAYAAAVSGYAANLETLNTSLADVNAYIDSKVGPAVTNEVTSQVNSKMNNYALAATVEESISEVYSEISDVREHMESDYLYASGGQMYGNITFSYGGIATNNSNAAGGFEFDIDGTPVIISDTMSIKVGTDSDPFLADYTYHFPKPESKEGTLALTSDIPENPAYHEHRIHVSINDMGYKVSGDVFFTLIAKESPFEINSMDSLVNILKNVKEATSKSTSIMATGYVVTDKSTDTTMHNICSVHTDSYPRLVLNYINNKESAVKEFTVMHSGSTLNCIVTDTVKELNN